MKSRILITFFVLLLAGLLIGCGGNDQTQNTLTISASDDFKYDPETVTVKAGEEVTLNFNNKGEVEHSFNLLKADAELEHVLKEADDEEHMHEELILDVHELAGGESVTETFTAPAEPGDYVFFCSLPGHAEAGEVGTLTVVP
ncbi:MAG: cupredoxin domain-containing protein [Ardenticatenaceae bacterium]|nr:cupredoxin domain-containing protein [Anaerolineales bacterium]MCB8973801.1 cupredoxin domain-containing protein [Ardenticatenaceae bacterium]